MKKGLLTGLILMMTYSCTAQTKDALAEKILLYQLPNGAWGKQLVGGTTVNYESPVDSNLLKKIKSTGNDHATIDNNATTREINALVKAYGTTGNPAYLAAATKGVEYLLQMQYENGGFPQYFPNKQIYRKQITYNDNAMINALTVLHHIATGTSGFDVFAPDLKLRSQTAVAKGITCILKNQVLQNGVPSIWADQYDETTLQPAKARAFEPVSLATGESVGIIRFLMLQPQTPAIANSIKSAVQWFQQNKIDGYSYSITKQNNKAIRTLVAEQGSVVWARFYDIGSNRPVFGDRDGSVTYNYSDISEERKNGYSWYNNAAQKLLDKEFPKWLASNKKTE